MAKGKSPKVSKFKDSDKTGHPGQSYLDLRFVTSVTAFISRKKYEGKTS